MPNYKLRGLPAALFVFACLHQGATAQEQAPSPAVASEGASPSLSSPSLSSPSLSPPSLSCCAIARGTVVEIEIVTPLTSRTNRHGDEFAIRLASPIVASGQEIVPAGATGLGQVVHGARSRMMGGPGELTLAARYVEHQGVRIPLHRLRFQATARSNEGAATALALTPYVGPLAFFVTGGEVVVPAGTLVTAQVAADVELPAR